MVWITLSFVLYIANINENYRTQTIHNVYNLMFRILVDHILLIQSSANNGPFENYRKIAKVDELFRVIRTVHQDQLGIQKHTKRYSLSLFIV